MRRDSNTTCASCNSPISFGQFYFRCLCGCDGVRCRQCASALAPDQFNRGNATVRNNTSHRSARTLSSAANISSTNRHSPLLSNIFSGPIDVRSLHRQSQQDSTCSQFARYSALSQHQFADKLRHLIREGCFNHIGNAEIRIECQSAYAVTLRINSVYNAYNRRARLLCGCQFHCANRTLTFLDLSN